MNESGAICASAWAISPAEWRVEPYRGRTALESIAISNDDIGVMTTPAPVFSELSGLSGAAPRTFAGAESTGSVNDSTGTSPWPRFKAFVAVDEKNDCPREGARTPVLTEPRTTNRRSGCPHTVSFPSTVFPKSLSCSLL